MRTVQEDQGSNASGAPINSTGRSSFQLGAETNPSLRNTSNDWYMSLTFNDTRAQGTAAQWLTSWLSVPNGASGSACIYRLGGLNITATSTGSNGCYGVLSSPCISALQNDVGSGVVSPGQSCPTLTVSYESRKQCAMGFSDGITSTSKLRRLERSH